MHINNHFADSEAAQASKGDFDKRAVRNFHQRLGAIIGERLESRAQSRGQDHRLHWPIFSSSRCCKATSTPFLPCRCLAVCSARYTERCWPPVQPNETIRCLKPRR